MSDTNVQVNYGEMFREPCKRDNQSTNNPPHRWPHLTTHIISSKLRYELEQPQSKFSSTN